MKEMTISSSGVFLCRAELADNLWTRGRGLLGRKQLGEDRGIWIRRCKSVHTLFMRFPIDLVYLSADGTVVKTCSGIQPSHFSLGGKQAHSVLELPAGFLGRKPIMVGEKLVARPVGHRFSESFGEELGDAPEPVPSVPPVPNDGPLRLRRWLRRGAGKSSVGATQRNADSDRQNRRPEERFSISVLSVDDTEFPEVAALFNVYQNGRPASNLDPSQLKIQEGGAPASLSSLQRVFDPDMPLGLVIAMNIGWLTDEASLSKAREFATNLIDKLKPNDTAAVLIFDEEGIVQQGFTADKAGLTQAVADLGPGRKIALLDIVAEVAQFAVDAEQRRLAVVLVIDSCEFLSRSKLSREKSLQLARNSGCPYFVVGIGPETDPAQDGHIFLTGLTNPSGGQLLEDVEISHAAEVYASCEELLCSDYLATFRTSAPSTLYNRSLKLSLEKVAAEGSTSVNYVPISEEHADAAFSATNQSQRRKVSFQVLFPSPQFVVPLAFPAIMPFVWIGLGVRGTLQLLKLAWRRAIGAGRQFFARRSHSIVPVLSWDDGRVEPMSMDSGLANNANLDDADEDNLGSQALVLETTGLDDADEDGLGSQTPVLESWGLDDAEEDNLGSQALVLETSVLDDADEDSLDFQALVLETSVLDDADEDSLGSRALVLETSGLDDADEDSLGSRALVLETSGLDDADVDSLGSQAPVLETSGLVDADVDSLGSQAPVLETSGLVDADVDSLGSQAPVPETSGLDDAGEDGLSSLALALETSGLLDLDEDSPGFRTLVLETCGLDDADVDSPGSQAPVLETPGLDDADGDSLGSQAPVQETSGLDDADADSLDSQAPVLETSGLDDAEGDSLGCQATVLVTSGLDEERSYQVVGKPVTIGSGKHCDIRLQAAAGVSAVHARMWWRDGRLMLHHLAPGLATVVSERHVIWTSLEDGDEAAIGPYLLRIALQREEGQQEGDTDLAENGWQNDYSAIPLIRAN